MQQEIIQSRNFRERLAQSVKNDGRNKKAIANAAGVHPSALSRWLAGATPDHANCERLAKALHTSVKSLLFGDTDENARPYAYDDTDSNDGVVRDAVAAYHVTRRALPASYVIPLADALAQLRADLDAIEHAPTPADRRRAFLFMREAHLQLLARALHID